jgi:hypothetical protein
MPAHFEAVTGNSVAVVLPGEHWCTWFWQRDRAGEGGELLLMMAVHIDENSECK